MRSREHPIPERDERARPLAVFDDGAKRAGRAMIAAYEAADSWIDGVRAALFVLLAFLDRHPGLARLMLVDSLAGDQPMLACRSRLLEQLAQALEAERPVSALGSPAPFGADAVVGSIAAILHGRLLEYPVPRLRDLHSSLMGVIVLPYLGADAARIELARVAGVDSQPRVSTTGPATSAADTV